MKQITFKQRTLKPFGFILLTTGLTGILSGCATAFQKTQISSLPVPEIEDAWHAKHVEESIIAVPRSELRAWMDQTELSDILPGSDQFPSVTGTEMLGSGEWGQPGSRRKVYLSDGHWVVEEVLVARPERFEYIVWNFSAPTRHLIKYATGRFEYEDLGDGRTAVTWTYRFRPRSPVFQPFVNHFAEKRFSTFMASGLNAIREKAEAAHRRGS